MIKDIKDREPNQGTINQLERLLEEAKSGELRSLFYITGFDDDAVSHGWSLDYRNTPRRLLAEMVMAQHDLVVNIELKERDSVLCGALDN